MPTVGGLLLWSAIALALYPLAAGHLWSIVLDVTAVGFGGGLGTTLQTRLMDVAGEAQALAAALNLRPSTSPTPWDVARRNGYCRGLRVDIDRVGGVRLGARRVGHLGDLHPH